MRAALRTITTGLAGAAAAALVGCGAGDAPRTSDPASKTPKYRPGLPLEVSRQSTVPEGDLSVTRLTYRASDGQRVPALFSVPARQESLGCLVHVGGFGTTRSAPLAVREGLGALRLSTFSIDPRTLGERGTPEDTLAAIRTPKGLLDMILGTVADIRTGIDFLTERPECRRNVAIWGFSFGGAVSTLVAAQDVRIKSALLAGIGATYKQQLLFRPIASAAVAGVPEYLPGTDTDPGALRDALKILSPYDNARWIGRIAPRPVMLMVGRFDPLVAPGDAMAIQAAVRPPKTVRYYDGGHDPFVEGPDRDSNVVRAAQFLVSTMNLPYPAP